MNFKYIENKIINGKKLAAAYRLAITENINYLKATHQINPGLAFILVGNNPASEIYIKNKIKYCNQVGIKSFDYRFPTSADQESIIRLINKLNQQQDIHGILVQLPLPSHLDEFLILNKIDSNKDVDGFGVINIGKLFSNQLGLIACTPMGCLKILKYLDIELSGKKLVIVGRSNIVGKPMALLMLREGLTVSIVHSKTINIQEETKTADILIVAAGVPGLVNNSWVKPGAIILDVGINKISDRKNINKIIGDVDFEQVKTSVKYITPVPGGVGPMTIVSILENTIKAACWLNEIKEPEIIIK